MCWVFIAGLSLVSANGGYSLVAVHGLLVAAVSLVAEHRLSSCGAWAELLHGMWDLPGLGIEPMSLALAGGFFTPEPPEMLHGLFFISLVVEELFLLIFRFLSSVVAL